MKQREIFRFELTYQIRRPWPWLCFATLSLFSFFNTRSFVVPATMPEDFIVNSPFLIAVVSVFSCLIWLLIAPAMAGEAAARDAHTGMHPLLYTTPISKREYLGGRLLAAFVLNAFVLLGVQVGSLLAIYAPGMDPEVIGPFRLAAYLSAYAFIALPNAFIATTIQFGAALFSGRSLASYFGSIVLFFLSVPFSIAVTFLLGQPTLGKMTDPIGMIGIMNTMMLEWTIVEKNVRMFTPEGAVLWNRLLWIGISLALVALIHLRFRFAHRTGADVWSRIVQRFATKPAAPTDELPMRSVAARRAVTIPDVDLTFGFTTQVRQVLAITWSSFMMIVKNPAGIFLLAMYPVFLFIVLYFELQHWGVPMLPRTEMLLTKFLTAPINHFEDFRVIVPILIIYFAGELVWRERDAGISENVDATAVSEWTLFLGKFLGLGLLLVTFIAVLILDGVLLQVSKGFYEFRIADYLSVLYGLQLPEYLLFAVLTFALHAVVNHKHIGMLVSLVAFFLIVFAPFLNVEHNLLVYTASPAWHYTDMRGFGGSVGPWLWFKLYWAAWALMLAVIVRLLWVRGREPGFRPRMAIARRRFTRSTVGVAVLAAVLIGSLAGFIFYNTNVLNEFETNAERVASQAEYERRYGRYEGVAQPERIATSLAVDIHPKRRAVITRGSYRLVNRTAVAIDSIHLETASFAETTVAFDREATRVHADDDLHHYIYALAQPLQPGDTITLNFDVKFAPRGFRNSGSSPAVVENGTYFTGAALPLIGYQPGRELISADDRRKQGLPRTVTFPVPEDVDPNVATGVGALFEAIVSTDEGQTAVAPGVLRRSWTEGGRSFFHYGSDVPIVGQYSFFSARYAVHRERWNDVDVVFYHHPRDTVNLSRMVRSARASLDYYSAQFGPYPYPFLQFVEQAAKGMGMGVDGSGVITGLEGLFLLTPTQELDAVFQIVAHEMGHQWWGVQLKHANAEGGIVLSESLAWYSGMQVVKREMGREQLRVFMDYMREPSPWPPIRTGLPLLRAMDPYAGYRKGPFAFYALSEYVGEERVNGALRSLLRKQGVGSTSLVTTLDLYRELKAVTPDSLKPLLHDLFEVNTFWAFDTEKASAKQLPSGEWEVTFEVAASKVVADSAGKETVLPMNEMVEIGIFAAARPGEILGRPLYVKKHRVRSGMQQITILVKERPARGGIDPYNLLDWEDGDNIEPIEIDGAE